MAWFWWLEVCANESKHVLNHSRGEKNYFLMAWFWWSGSMRKCIKTRFEPLQTLKNNFLRTWIWWCENASKHVFKGTVSQDFLLLVFFTNQFPPSPWVHQ
jgi:hypothetical protein